MLSHVFFLRRLADIPIFNDGGGGDDYTSYLRIYGYPLQ
jgi:hypothetical protein